jgi:hypothetical protein
VDVDGYALAAPVPQPLHDAGHAGYQAPVVVGALQVDLPRVVLRRLPDRGVQVGRFPDRGVQVGLEQGEVRVEP